MIKDFKLKSGQINFENTKGAYSVIVIKDGVFHNMTEDQRLELIRILQKPNDKLQEVVDLDSLF